MNLDYLNEFVYLANTLNFRLTAEHFFVSRSVISRHLAALEESLGAVLIERSARGIELTEAGKVFYQEAQGVLKSWNLAKERVRAMTQPSSKLVRIGYLRNGARPFLVRFVKHMTTEYPEINLSLQCMNYQEARQAMNEHGVDVVLGINVDSSLSQNYRSTMIYRDRFVITCSHSHPLARFEDGISLDDLRDHKVLVPDSYISAGLGPDVRSLIDDETLAECEEIYQDMDLLYLKIQTEECAAFVSNMNAVMFDGPLKILPMKDIDTAFTISAYYHNDFTGDAFDLCQQGFEECKRALAAEAPELFRW